MSQLEQRVARLEKSLRNYRIILGMSLIIICAFAIISARKKDSLVPDRIQAKSFQVMDDNGNTLAKLSKEKGNGSLCTYTPTGQKVVNLFTAEGGSGGINTFDADGDILFKVTRTTGGGSYMALCNSKAKEIIEFGVTDNESGYMRANDKNGDKLAWLTYSSDGGGYFSLSNNKKELVRLSTPNVGDALVFPMHRETG